MGKYVTFRQLKEVIDSLSNEMLDKDVVVCDDDNEEVFSVERVVITSPETEDDLLNGCFDEDQCCLIFNVSPQIVKIRN